MNDAVSVFIAGRRARIDEATAGFGWTATTNSRQRRQTGARMSPKSSRDRIGAAQMQIASGARCAAHSPARPPIRSSVRSYDGFDKCHIASTFALFAAIVVLTFSTTARAQVPGAHDNHVAQAAEIYVALQPQLHQFMPDIRVSIVIKRGFWGGATTTTQRPGLVAYVGSSMEMTSYPSRGKELASARWLCARVALAAAGLRMPIRHIEVQGQPSPAQVRAGFGDFHVMAACA
jgi:hypothetical protein